MRATIYAALVFSALAGTVLSQSFTYSDFSSSIGITMNNSANQNGNELQITPAINTQWGTAYYYVPMQVIGGFDTTFTFRVTSPGADGFTFIIQNDATGSAAQSNSSGETMGYGGLTPISNCIVVEFDNYVNGTAGDTSNNEISIHTEGMNPNSELEVSSIGRVTPSVTFANGQIHTARIEYIPGTLNIYLDNLTVPVLSTSYDIVAGATQINGTPVGGLSLFNNDSAYVGFTAATGGLNQSHDILSWQWTTAAPPPACYAGNIVDGQGNPVDLLLVNGSAGGFFRTVPVTAFQTFTFDFLAPPLNPNPAPFVIWGHIGLPPAAAAYVSPFGTMCFGPALLYPAPWHFTLIDSFTNSSVAILPGSMAPWSFTIPGGVGAAITFAIQGFTVADATTLALSNAVVVDITLGPPPVITSVSPLSTIPGSPITITGVDFQIGAVVKLGGAPIGITSFSPTSIEFPMPTGLSCDTPLTVTNPDGQMAGPFNFNPTPTVTNTLFSQGSTAGGNAFYIVGTGFTPGVTITIGGAPATITTLNPGVIIVSTPPGVVGVQTVVVTTVQGCVTATSYTYI